MKRTTIFSVLAFAFLASMHSVVDAQSCSSSCVGDIRSQIEQVRNGISFSVYEKYVNRLGDKVASRLRQIYTDKEMRDVENIQLFLPVILEAFKYPSLIKDPHDRKGAKTYKLLKRVKSQTREPKVVTLINATLRSLR